MTGVQLHQALDHLVALYLESHPTRMPSSTSVLELIEWSAAQQNVPGYLDGGPAAKCRDCGEFLSGIRVAMALDRCAKCDGRPRGGRGRRVA